MGDSVSKALRERVAAAARQRCGYCMTDQRVSGAQMHVEHIVPRARGGSSHESNLWLSCAWCNSYKGIQVEAQDPETGVWIPLFNPRRQPWIEHFAWAEDATWIVGLTPTGRATVTALNLNNPYIVPARRLWALAGWHPPK
ncbi:HNH endonuclease [uncultured Thiodictyon sp.]|uniref:HNH endonuclease n=1 Tax=uncultured Thiodictyon sp. TaxID=1846217 RepID=UPI0025F75B9C|nr:HNH endonuclease [uncultured Thiodictyon sp.]